MKINVISDLHLGLDYNTEDSRTRINWLGFDPTKLEPADVLVVAGDLAIGNSFDRAKAELLDAIKGKFREVIIIKGNHDYWTFPEDEYGIYVQTFCGMESKMPKEIRLVTELDDVVFIACTLWSPVSETYRQPVRRMMNDFRYINSFDIDRQNELYSNDKSWLKWNMSRHAGKKIVIITHHNPYVEMIPSQYLTGFMSKINPAYTVIDGSCDNIRPDVWICGHIHEPFDEYLPIGSKTVHCVRNPIGYRQGGEFSVDYPQCSSENWYNKIIEV